MIAVLAFDIGGSKLLAGLVTQDGQILDSEWRELAAGMDIHALEDMLVGDAETLRSRNRHVSIQAAGVNIPGLADAKQGMWVCAVFSGINNYPIARRLSERLGMPVFIENDVNACAWAEKIYGCCQQVSDFLWVTVSNGCGGGLILDGRLYRGAFNGASEIGHIIVERGAEALPCPCGHVGCLESMAAGPAIARRYATQKRIADSGAPDASEIAALARQGDEVAMQVMRKTGWYIGQALGACANMLNLRRYVLGGGVIQSYDLFAQDIQEAFCQSAFNVPNREADIVRTALGYEAGLMGAAAIAWYPI